MKTARWLGAACLLLGPAAWAQQGPPAGKGSPHEEVIEQLLTTLGQMTKALAGVKDGTSAEAARPPLKQAAEQFLTVRKKSHELKQPDKGEKDQLEEKYQKKLAEAVQEFRKEIRRVQTVPGGPALLKELDPVLQPPAKQKQLQPTDW